MIFGLGVVVLCCALLGCQDSFRLGSLSSKDRSENPTDTENQQPEQSAFDRRNTPIPGTIGAACYIDGLQDVLVQGYGLVANLAGTGSGECPDMLRKELMAVIVRHQKLHGDRQIAQTLTVGSLIDSRNTAVVKVYGLIPPGSVKGDRFDLIVQALPDTGTTSLEGGRLYTGDLRVYGGPLSSSPTSRIFAHASGQVFINPFETKTYQGTTLLRRSGFILNGGVVTENRQIGLMLHQPSYGTARMIEQKINSIFGPPPDNPLWQTAKAVSAERIELNIPRQYRNQLERFLGLVSNVFIRSDPGYIESMANELARQISDPMANAEAISYAWQVMGRTALPMIQSLYTSANVQAAFYAARAGALIGDTTAIQRLEFFAADPQASYRTRAVRTLGLCRDTNARRILRRMVDDADMEIRILAYKGLSRWNDRSIQSRFIGKDNFILEVVDSKARPMVYVTRSRISKVVLFGDIKLDPPVFYTHPDDSIMLTASTGDTQVSLLRKTPSGRSSGRIDMPLNLASVIELMGNDPAVDRKTGQIFGLGLPYSHVVSILHQLCQDGAIPARFKIEEIAEIAEPPDDIIGRPERD